MKALFSPGFLLFSLLAGGAAVVVYFFFTPKEAPAPVVATGDPARYKNRIAVAEYYERCARETRDVKYAHECMLRAAQARREAAQFQ